MEIEIKSKEVIYHLTLTEKELNVLYKLLGNLTEDLATEQLGMTEEQYGVTYSMYNNIDDMFRNEE